jgi:hypothetical protein
VQRVERILEQWRTLLEIHERIEIKIVPDFEKLARTAPKHGGSHPLLFEMEIDAGHASDATDDELLLEKGPPEGGQASSGVCHSGRSTMHTLIMRP